MEYGNRSAFLTHHRRRIAVLFGLLCLGMVGLTGRLVFLMMYRADHYSEMAEDLLLSKWDAFCLQLEAFYPLFRSFLANEMYSDLLAPDDTGTEHMLIRLQWTAIQYAAIRQALFLTYLPENAGTLSYESVRQALVILTRMTGYEEEDIYEYLENSFKSLLWDFGYLAFIMGSSL